MKLSKTRPNLGFTLLELMVAISIIAILITLGLSSYATAQKKGRDTRRKGDIKDIRTALEQYYSVCGFQYPTPDGSFYSPVICATPGVSIAIMPTVPADPRGTTPYYCPTPVPPATESCNSDIYTVCAILEAETPPEYCLNNAQ